MESSNSRGRYDRANMVFQARPNRKFRMSLAQGHRHFIIEFHIAVDRLSYEE
jgi:hypothetical protein